MIPLSNHCFCSEIRNLKELIGDPNIGKTATNLAHSKKMYLTLECYVLGGLNYRLPTTSQWDGRTTISQSKDLPGLTAESLD